MDKKIQLLVDMPDGSTITLNLEYNSTELTKNVYKSGYSLCNAIAEYLGGEFGKVTPLGDTKLY